MTTRFNEPHPSYLGELGAIVEMNTMLALLHPAGNWTWISSGAERLAVCTVQAARKRAFPLLERLEGRFAAALEELQRATTPPNWTDGPTPMQFDKPPPADNVRGVFLEILMTKSLAPSITERTLRERLLSVRQAVATVVEQMGSTAQAYFMTGRLAAGFRQPWLSHWTEPELTRLIEKAATLLRLSLGYEIRDLSGHCSAGPQGLARSEELERATQLCAELRRCPGAGVGNTDKDAAPAVDRSRLMKNFDTLWSIVRTCYEPQQAQLTAGGVVVDQLSRRKQFSGILYRCDQFLQQKICSSESFRKWRQLTGIRPKTRQANRTHRYYTAEELRQTVACASSHKERREKELEEFLENPAFHHLPEARFIEARAGTQHALVSHALLGKVTSGQPTQVERSLGASTR